jgi:hypothetical protein
MRALTIRLLEAVGPEIRWIFVFAAIVVATFVVFVGIALHAVFDAHDEDEREVRYQVFRDLLDLFRPSGHQ